MIDSLLGITLVNTFIGLANVSKNTAQGDILKQILTILKGEKPMHKKLMALSECVDYEIEREVDKELEKYRETGGLTSAGHGRLHLLREYRNDIRMLLCEQKAIDGYSAEPMAATAKSPY